MPRGISLEETSKTTSLETLDIINPEDNKTTGDKIEMIEMIDMTGKTDKTIDPKDQKETSIKTTIEIKTENPQDNIKNQIGMMKNQEKEDREDKEDKEVEIEEKEIH